MSCLVFFLMIRRPPRSTRTTHSFPTRRSSDLFAVHGFADFIVTTFWRFQEAQLGLQHVLDRRIETTGGQVGINLVLILIGLSLDAGLVQYGFGIGFLDGALLVTDGLAFEGRDFFAQAGTLIEPMGGANV